MYDTPGDAANAAPVTFDVTQGLLGIGIKEATDPFYKVQFSHFTQAFGRVQLRPGMLLINVNGQDTNGLDYLQVRELLRPRPCKMVFLPTMAAQQAVSTTGVGQQPVVATVVGHAVSTTGVGQQPVVATVVGIYNVPAVGVPVAGVPVVGVPVAGGVAQQPVAGVPVA
jgi:hypothetical protein